MSRKCPECSVPLKSFAFHEVMLDECPDCGGVWFDDGELKRCQAGGTIGLVEIEDEIVPAVSIHVADDHGRLCPCCDFRLTTYRYLYTSDILLDECEKCFGVWVQDGELQKMADFLDGEKAPANLEALRQARTRAQAVGLVERLEKEAPENRLRTSRIVTLWHSLSKRPMPFAGSRS